MAKAEKKMDAFAPLKAYHRAAAALFGKVEKARDDGLGAATLQARSIQPGAPVQGKPPAARTSLEPGFA